MFPSTKIVHKSILTAKKTINAFSSARGRQVSYSLGIIKQTKNKTTAHDKKVRNMMNMNKSVNRHSDFDRIVLQRNCGERVLQLYQIY